MDLNVSWTILNREEVASITRAGSDDVHRSRATHCEQMKTIEAVYSPAKTFKVPLEMCHLIYKLHICIFVCQLIICV